MIEFSFEKDIARFHSAWSEWKHSTYLKHIPRHNNLGVQGFYGSGKTEFLRQFCEQNKDAVYLYFKHLDSKNALSLFCGQHLNGTSADSWIEAIEKYKHLTGARFQLFFVDDDDRSAVYKDFESAIHSIKLHDHTLVLPVKTFAPVSIQEPGNIKPRSIADYLRIFPDYNKADVIRLHGLTGGLPAVTKNWTQVYPLRIISSCFLDMTPLFHVLFRRFCSVYSARRKATIRSYTASPAENTDSARLQRI